MPYTTTHRGATAPKRRRGGAERESEDLRLVSVVLMEPSVVTVDVDGYLVSIYHGLPDLLNLYISHASFADIGDLRGADGSPSLITVASGTGLPEVVVVLRSDFRGLLFPPGVALVAETGVLFVGGGQVARAYSLVEPAKRQWEEDVEVGFFRWQRVDDVMLMSAELELAAWTLSGEKLWTRFVEPPWGYDVVGGVVQLDVMGSVSTFPLHPGQS